MKVSKAIEILELEVKNPYHFEPPDTRNAMELGIEALKERAEAINKSLPLWHELLPGETPEDDTT